MLKVGYITDITECVKNRMTFLAWSTPAMVVLKNLATVLIPCRLKWARTKDIDQHYMSGYHLSIFPFNVEMTFFHV